MQMSIRDKLLQTDVTINRIPILGHNMYYILKNGEAYFSAVAASFFCGKRGGREGEQTRRIKNVVGLVNSIIFKFLKGKKMSSHHVQGKNTLYRKGL